MNLTTAISIVNDGVLVGPNKGCPVLYIRDEDNPDQFQALNTKEFYEYIKKQIKSLDDMLTYREKVLKDEEKYQKYVNELRNFLVFVIDCIYYGKERETNKYKNLSGQYWWAKNNFTSMNL